MHSAPRQSSSEKNSLQAAAQIHANDDMSASQDISFVTKATAIDVLPAAFVLRMRCSRVANCAWQI